jgi:hypothetical protein
MGQFDLKSLFASGGGLFLHGKLKIAKVKSLLFGSY